MEEMKFVGTMGGVMSNEGGILEVKKLYLEVWNYVIESSVLGTWLCWFYVKQDIKEMVECLGKRK